MMGRHSLWSSLLEEWKRRSPLRCAWIVEAWWRVGGDGTYTQKRHTSTINHGCHNSTISLLQGILWIKFSMRHNFHKILKCIKTFYHIELAITIMSCTQHHSKHSKHINEQKVSHKPFRLVHHDSIVKDHKFPMMQNSISPYQNSNHKAHWFTTTSFINPKNTQWIKIPTLCINPNWLVHQNSQFQAQHQ